MGEWAGGVGGRGRCCPCLELEGGAACGLHGEALQLPGRGRRHDAPNHVPQRWPVHLCQGEVGGCSNSRHDPPNHVPQRWPVHLCRVILSTSCENDSSQ